MFWAGAACGLSLLLLIAASGSGTTDRLAIWTGATSLGDSALHQTGGVLVSDLSSFVLGLTNSEGAVFIAAADNSTIGGSTLTLSSGAGTVRSGHLYIQTPDGNGASGAGGDINIMAGQGDGQHGVINLFSGRLVAIESPADLAPTGSGTQSLGSMDDYWKDGYFGQLTFVDDSDPPADPVVPVAWVTVRIGTNEFRTPLYQ